MKKRVGPSPLAPMRGVITQPSLANQRYAWINRVTLLVDTVMTLHVRLLTRVLHFRLTAWKPVGATAREESLHVISRRVTIGVMPSRICDHTTLWKRTWGRNGDSDSEDKPTSTGLPL